MSLADVMSHSGLAGYAVVALVVFFVTFLAILARLFWPSRRDELEKDGRIPLEDERPHLPRHGGTA
jgi:cbb3-type cytochrome oxidase subunit 3